MKKRYTFTVKHKDGSTITGNCLAVSGWQADGYAQFVAMRKGWDERDIVVRVENARDTSGSNESWLERKRIEAAYDAAMGHDLDDEGFSLHDYS